MPPVKTTCPYCGVGCGVRVEMKDGQANVRGDEDHPANFGRLCSKGAALGETIDRDGRLLYPEINGRRAAWDDALDLVAAKFSESIAEHGPDSVAFYVSGQFLTEDYYVANKLMKGFIGSANIDTNSRLCMASSVAGHNRAFGADVVPGTYEDLELADLIVLVGSNLAWCHPVLYQRIAAAKDRRPDMKIVLVDPRRTMTADIADVHLPIRADGDVALFSGLLSWLAEHDALDRAYIAAHTTGFDETLATARAVSLDDICEQTGLTQSDLCSFYALFAKTEKVVTVFSQGVNQSSCGTDKVNTILNCHLASGRIGKPGAGPFSVTGQPNAMGGREVGGLANMLAAHMDIASPAHRDLVQRFWHAPTIAERPGLKAVQLFQAVADGRIKALWIMATNPVDSMPEADAVAAALKACPFVVVSDVTQTDTTRFAHVLLPALAWGEKDGTVTNSERRISRQRAFLPAPGEARPDWKIMCDVAARMGFADSFRFVSSADVFAEHAGLSGFENEGTRAFDIGTFARISAEGYDRLDPFQWPLPAGQTVPTARFFAQGAFFTPDWKARFIPTVSDQKKRTSTSYPFILNTGRVRDHWHTMTRTAKSVRLSQHLAEPFVEIHPADAEANGIAEATIVRVATANGAVLLRALLSPRQSRGSVFVPFHWTDQMAALARVDALVPSRTDPYSGQPALKHVAASIAPFAAAHYGFAVVRERPASFDADYWALAKCDGGWRVEFAFAAEDSDWLDFAGRLFGHAPEYVLSYHDTNAGQQRFAGFDEGRLVGALFLAPEPVAVSREWAVAQLAADFTSQKRLAVLAGRAGRGGADKGAIVCACFSVGANQIAGAVTAGCRTVQAVGEAVQAGTNCGSCRAEIRGIINAHQLQAAE